MAPRRPRAASRDLLVTVQQRPSADAIDAASGEPVDGPWTTLVATMPAARIDLTGWERQRADQLSERYDARWQINYRADMDPDLVDVPKLRRLQFNGRTLDIVAAMQVGRREGIELFTIASGR